MKKMAVWVLGLLGTVLVAVGNGLRRTSLRMAMVSSKDGRGQGDRSNPRPSPTTKSPSEWASQYRASLPPGGLMVRVGSRATCSPPPTDTDEDFLILVKDKDEAVRNLLEMGFETESDPKHIHDYNIMGRESRFGFASLRFGEVNYIVTDDIFFFERFLTGAYVARELNLIDKKDRVLVHSAIRGASYANAFCPDFSVRDHLEIYTRVKMINEEKMEIVTSDTIDIGIREAVTNDLAEKSMEAAMAHPAIADVPF
ncbi:MAG: hypothetical protein QM805_07845 [Pseudomonas sp.]